MRWQAITLIAAICVVATALAQPTSPPRTLPPSVSSPEGIRPKAPLFPNDPPEQRIEEIKPLKEELITFEPAAVQASAVSGHWQVRTGSELLKDFGNERLAAFEAVRIIKELGVNQLGTVSGSIPPFEYWLADGKSPKAVKTQIVIVPVSSRTIRAEQVGGTWMLTDGAKGLYDFGNDADGAKKAAMVFRKYGFNQLGVIGSPRPTMLYPLSDARQAAREKATPIPESVALGVVTDAARSSVLLPGNVFAGRKLPLDLKKLDAVRQGSEWTLTHDGTVLARFGSSESNARSALKAVKDAKPNQIARIGECGFPIFLVDELAIRIDPLGVPKFTLRGDRLKIQQLRDKWWLFEETRPVMEIGTKSDAELMLKTVHAYDLKLAFQFGRPEAGGLWLLSAGR